MKPIERFIIGKKKMMITEKNTYRWLCSCLVVGGLLLLSGCSGGSSGDDVPPSEQAYLQLGAVTRTAGAFEINDPATNIKLFLTTQTSLLQPVEGSTYSYSTDHWSSLTPFSVKENMQYYLYGYMPASLSATQSAPEGDYSKGMNLTLSNLPAITTDDICVLVGVQRVGANSGSPTVTEGQYGFLTGIKGQNYLNLLMAHLYAKMKVSFKIDPAYAELRSIHLKNITLSSKYADDASVAVSLRSGQGIGSPTFPSGSGEQVHSVILLDTKKILDKNFVSTPLTLDIPAYCRPMGLEGTYHLTLTTTYDVYDTKNQNLGERTSENKIDFNMAEVRPGQEKDIVLTVKPTYLYVLSEYDADNPTITLGE